MCRCHRTQLHLLAEPQFPAEHLHFLPLLKAQKLFGQVAGGGAAAAPSAPCPAGDPNPGYRHLSSPKGHFEKPAGVESRRGVGVQCQNYFRYKG